MSRLPSRRSISALRRLLQSEALGGVVLMASAILALAIANSPWARAYTDILHFHAGLSLTEWINDGLMAGFFLLVGLEIKRELTDGELRTWSAVSLPGLAALGGMLAPALIYCAFNLHSPATLRGWAIPAATDIAFALGVLALLGPRIPVSLKVFLTALAILDDLGAVIIIALFYASSLSLPMLGLAAATFALLMVLNRMGVVRLWPYLLLGAALWFFVLKSGVHATAAGVLLAMAIPIHLSPGAPESAHSPLHRLEHALAPWSAYLILPIFGLANAGVSFAGFTPALLLNRVTLGVALGLFLGKQAGVFTFVWIGVKLGITARPAKASWTQIYGLSLLCGVGFTMSLFIGLLAFADAPHLEVATKTGVLLGSLLSIIGGAAVLRFSTARPSRLISSSAAAREKAAGGLPPIDHRLLSQSADLCAKKMQWSRVT